MDLASDEDFESSSIPVNVNPSSTMFDDTQSVKESTEPIPSSIPADQPYDICIPLIDEERKASSDNDELLKEYSKLRLQFAELTAQNAELTAQKAELTARNAELTAQNAELTAQNEEKRKEEENLKSRK